MSDRIPTIPIVNEFAPKKVRDNVVEIGDVKRTSTDDRAKVIADSFACLDDDDIAEVKRVLAARDAKARDAVLDRIATDIDWLPVRESMQMADEITKVEGYKQDAWPSKIELAMILNLWSQTRAKPDDANG
jgi:hypothetical protein